MFHWAIWQDAFGPRRSAVKSKQFAALRNSDDSLSHRKSFESQKIGPISHNRRPCLPPLLLNRRMQFDPQIDEDDSVILFRFARSPIRGRFARLARTLQELLSGRNYPSAIESAIAEASVLTALIGQLIQPGWKFSIQVRGKGALRLLAADYLAPIEPGGSAKLRAMATFDDALRRVKEMPPWNESSGYFGILIDRNDGKQPFQGLVPLEQATLAGCAEDYFRRSEQIPTRFAIAVGKSAEAGDLKWRGGGIVIQRMPEAMPGTAESMGTETDGGEAPEDWNRVNALLSTVDELELTGPSTTMLRTLYGLFHEEQPHAGSLQRVEFGCSCSADKVRQGLSIYSSQDIASMTTSSGVVTAECQFCGRGYEFEPSSLGFEAVSE